MPKNWIMGKKCVWCGMTLGNRLGDTEKYHESCLKQKEKANGKKVL